MKQLKIGILTFHRCINYGSFWQAYCLAEGLKNRGHNCTILDHYSRQVNIAEWKCAFQPVLPQKVAKGDQKYYREKIRGFFRAFETLPLSQAFNINDPSAMGEYDMVMVGSDEVWNIMHPWYGNAPIFYGENISADCLVSYAASFGNYPAAWGLEYRLADRLRNFNHISVRDENSKIIIQNALGTEPDIVLDPCLQFGTAYIPKANKYEEMRYIAVYGHNFSKSFICNIRKYAQQHALQLASIGYRNDWADEQWLSADPYDYANFISKAKAVATNFFHGCVFALKEQKPFVCETSPYRTNKIKDLISQTGSEEHLMNEHARYEQYDNALYKSVNEHVLNRITDLRKNSNNYLDMILQPAKSLHYEDYKQAG